MWYRWKKSASATATVAEVEPQSQRRHPRHKVRTLAYVTVDSLQRGILRDLSESGIATHTVPPLAQNRRIQVRLDLQNPRAHIETDARVVWTDSLGQAGVEFLELPPRSRRALKEWLLTQFLADAHRAGADDAGDLLFSDTPRPVIRLGQTGMRLVRPPAPRTKAPDLHFWWFTVPVQKFSRFVDALVLLCATLLFHVVALLMTDTLPAWWIASALVLVVTGILTLSYWLLFAVCIGVTPGRRLAELASHDTQRLKTVEEDGVRFR